MLVTVISFTVYIIPRIEKSEEQDVQIKVIEMQRSRLNLYRPECWNRVIRADIWLNCEVFRPTVNMTQKHMLENNTRADAHKSLSLTHPCSHTLAAHTCLESLPIFWSNLVRVHLGRPAALPTATGWDEELRARTAGVTVRLPRPGHSESSFRTDSAVCPIMLRHLCR